MKDLSLTELLEQNANYTDEDAGDYSLDEYGYGTEEVCCECVYNVAQCVCDRRAADEYGWIDANGEHI